MLSKLAEISLQRGTFLKNEPGVAIMEIATGSGVYWARVWKNEHGESFIMTDANGELIETAKKGVMLDIGAHVGRYTMPMATKATTVYAFEPEHQNFAELKEYTINFKNVVLVQKAVSNHCGSTPLFLMKNRRLRHTISDAVASRQGVDDCVSVNTTTIDAYCEENNIQNITAIKIDVEGAEGLVLEGGIKTLKREKALLALETHQKIDCRRIYEILIECGYQVTINYKIVTEIEPDQQYFCVK